MPRLRERPHVSCNFRRDRSSGGRTQDGQTIRVAAGLIIPGQRDLPDTETRSEPDRQQRRSGSTQTRQKTHRAFVKCVGRLSVPMSETPRHLSRYHKPAGYDAIQATPGRRRLRDKEPAGRHRLRRSVGCRPNLPDRQPSAGMQTRVLITEPLPLGLTRRGTDVFVGQIELASVSECDPGIMHSGII
jgi:hypothetical protein